MSLTIRDLRRGDIMLKHGIYKSSHALIATGQALFSHNVQDAGALTVHAALFYGEGKVIESSTPGLGITVLEPKVKWDVYRYRDAEMAELATLVAENYLHLQQSGKGYGDYSKGSALGSLFHSSSLGPRAKEKASKLWEDGHTRTFFCSNFVIRCFLAAGQTYSPVRYPIQADMDTTPKDLMARLNKDSSNWNHMKDFEL